MRSSTSTSSSSNGCLTLIVVLLVLGFVVSLVKAMAHGAQENPITASIIAALTLAAIIGIAILTKKRNAAKARARMEAARAEEQRQLEEQQRFRQERWTYLCSRYGEQNAQRIWDGRIWMGCTVDMMQEILGQPLAMDEKVLKTKIKHTYKYRPTGTNRYGLRVFVEDGQVTGWEDKSDD